MFFLCYCRPERQEAVQEEGQKAVESTAAGVDGQAAVGRAKSGQGQE